MPAHIVKAGLDLSSVVLIVGTLLDVLPRIAAALSVVWYSYLMIREIRRYYREKMYSIKPPEDDSD